MKDEILSAEDRRHLERAEFMRAELRKPHPGVEVLIDGKPTVLSWDEYCVRFGGGVFKPRSSQTKGAV